MKKIVSVLFTALFAILCFTGCSKYSSNYNAILYAHSNDTDSASASFYKFEGTEVFKLKIESGKTAKIKYSGELETGNLTVYYDCGKTKTKLFSIASGDKLNAYSEELTADMVYIIIETSENCQNGTFDFEINYD